MIYYCLNFSWLFVPLWFFIASYTLPNCLLKLVKLYIPSSSLIGLFSMHVQEAQSFDPHHDPHFSDVVNERFGNGTIWNSSSVNKKNWKRKIGDWEN